MKSRLLFLGLCVSGLAGTALWLGCGSSEDAPAPVDAAPPDAGSPEADDGEEDEPSDNGLGDEGSVPPPIPSLDGGAAIPSKIRYVIVLIKENHTFDNYFTGFPGAETSTTAKVGNTTVTRPVAPNGPLPSDICHSNICGQHAYAGGAMNGFTNSTVGNLPLIHYTEAQIPNYWAYGRNFVLADHFFSTTLGPSAPGHEVFWVARSLTLDNPKCATPDGGGCTGYGCVATGPMTTTSYDQATCTTHTVAPCFDVPSLPDHLPQGFTWIDYGGAMATMVKSVTNDPGYKTHFRPASALVSDLTAGHLANLTIAHLSSGITSEHPAHGPCDGENQSVDIINAAMKLPEWNEMAIMVTWDDWGGFYDHVKPTVHTCNNGQVFNTGFRLPLLLVSPYAKKGFVLKTPTEQASVPRLVEELWGMKLMSTRDPNARDGTAGSLIGAFDFTQAPRAPLYLTKRTCPPQ